MTPAPEIIFRSATNKDAGQIKKIVYGVLEEYGLVPEPGGTDADLEDIDKNYLQRGGVFEVLQDTSGNIMGTVGLYPIDAEDPKTQKTVELRKMYFLPALRGQGWGKKTLTRMIERARELSFKRITLETHSSLKEAIGLYKSFGFAESCEGKHSARCDQTFSLEL
ncbi:MAG TPA: GNAT family N-acetyltransferase [Pyrinomonadaceae bacterium]|jgi:putative acetyltransferase|nr:GNAT family N-acetyltransferase [Pyrinomonadaceae bacterium]